jgi:hypothetical protein
VNEDPHHAQKDFEIKITMKPIQVCREAMKWAHDALPQGRAGAGAPTEQGGGSHLRRRCCTLWQARALVDLMTNPDHPKSPLPPGSPRSSPPQPPGSPRSSPRMSPLSPDAQVPPFPPCFFFFLFFFLVFNEVDTYC